MLGQSNGEYCDPYQGNQLLFSVWTGLICNLFKGERIINVYSSEESQFDVMMDVVLQVSENQCGLQVFRKNISTKLENTPLDRTGKNYIIYAQDLADAWNVLKMIWQRFHNQDGDELFLILTPTDQVNSESVQFVHNAWIQLYYFSVLIADTTLVHESFSSVCLNVLIANPYNIVKNNSELLSYRNFRFSEGSTKADWILMTSHLKSRLKNLNGYPIKIIMHKFKGLSEPVFDTSGKITRFMGTEGILINEYARFFNFTPIYNLPRDRIIYGGQLKNGSFTGGFKDMEEGFADIHGNRRRLITTLQQSLYLKTTEQITMVVLVPKSLPELKIIGTLFSTLDGAASKVSILFIALNIIAWTVVKVNNDIVTSHKDLKLYTHREKFNALVMVLMKTVCIVSNTSFQTPTCSKERIFYVGLSIWALAVTNIYIGTIVTRFAFRESSEIDTMEQLLHSGLKIACMKDACNDMIMESDKRNDNKELTVRQLLGKNLFLIYSSLGVPQRIAYDRDTALLCPMFVVDSMVEETLSKDGAELIRVMKEPLSTVFFSQIVRRGFPLLQRLENTQILLLEGGLLKHWYTSMKYHFVLKRNRTSTIGTSNGTPLILDNFKFTFLLWGFFIMTSVPVFILELICHRIKLE